MTSWTKDELSKIARTDDLHIAPFREDGRTYGTRSATVKVTPRDTNAEKEAR